MFLNVGEPISLRRQAQATGVYRVLAYMNPTLRRTVLLASAVVTAAAVPALAADPESGDVSNATPKVEWKGTAGGYGASIVADVNGSFPACGAPVCDEFTLNLKDAGDLTVAITTDDGSGFTTIEVEDPDGNITYNGGAETEATSVIRLKKAKAGTYLVRTMTNNPPAQGDAYTGTASLGGAPAAVTPPPSTGGGTTPPPASEPQQPQPAAAPTITVKPGKLSARKAKKKLTISLSSDGRVNGLVATLKKGSKTVGRGKLATLNGPGKIALKVKKLKKGAYTFRVAGRSDAGNVVAAQVKLKIGR